jgi:hypothetical protein
MILLIRIDIVKSSDSVRIGAKSVGEFAAVLVLNPGLRKMVNSRLLRKDYDLLVLWLAMNHQLPCK